MDALLPLLPAVLTKEQRPRVQVLRENAGILILQLPLLPVQKDSALMTQHPHLMVPATPLKQLAEPRELDASMLLNHAPPTLVPNPNVMPFEEPMQLSDAGTQRLPLPQLLVP